MPDKNHQYAIVYLCRKMNPVWKSRAFLASFFANDPGSEFPIYFLQKGYETSDSCKALDELTPEQRSRVRLLWVSDDGMDLHAYSKACSQLSDFSHLLFLNSNSIIYDETWAQQYQRALEITEGRDLIGATGSWEAMVSLGVTFPNPHIRSNAFLVDRLRFLDAYGENERITKKENHFLESGPDSLTNKYLAAGDRALVLDINGHLIAPEDWAKSHTYRAGNQENLLIGDLKTFRFHYLRKGKRLDISERCWGEQKCATGGFFMSWLPYRIWYKHLYSGYRFHFLMRLTRRFRANKSGS